MLTALVGARAYNWTTSLAFAELRVLRAIARHAPTSDIAETLRVTSNTVRAHLRKLLTPTVPEYATLTGYSEPFRPVIPKLSGHLFRA